MFRRYNSKEAIAVALLIAIRVAMPGDVFHFKPFHDLTYEGDVIQAQQHRLVGVDDCRRACILTSGCRGFNMRWGGLERQVGYCTLTALKVKKAIVSQQDNSFYGK